MSDALPAFQVSVICRLAVACVLIGMWGVPVVGAGNRADLYQEGEHAELLVVRITGPATEGAGILFHADEHHAWVLTARHVLYRQQRLIEGLAVSLRAWPEMQFSIDRESYLLHYQEDLAVFRIDLRQQGLSLQEILRGIPLDQLGASDGLDPGDLLFSLGHSPAGAWISPKAPVRFARGEGSGAFLFEQGCPPGHSGGAVFDEQWRLVGMMIEEVPPYCRALRIEMLLRIIQGWQLDIGLSKPPPREGGKASPRRINVAVMDFDNRSTLRMPNLGFVAQEITTTCLQTLPGIVLVTRGRLDALRRENEIASNFRPDLLHADVLVTGSIVRYDVETRTIWRFGHARKDTFRMAISLQILDAGTGRIRFSKYFGTERTRHYFEAASAPSQPIDLATELLEALLVEAQNDLRSALAQVAVGLDIVGGFVDVPIRSTPPGADVIVNGIYLEKTPVTLQITLEGTHEIRIELPGYETWRRRYKVQPGKGIEATLVPRR